MSGFFFIIHWKQLGMWEEWDQSDSFNILLNYEEAIPSPLAICKACMLLLKIFNTLDVREQESRIVRNARVSVLPFKKTNFLCTFVEVFFQYCDVCSLVNTHNQTQWHTLGDVVGSESWTLIWRRRWRVKNLKMFAINFCLPWHTFSRPKDMVFSIWTALSVDGTIFC